MEAFTCPLSAKAVASWQPHCLLGVSFSGYRAARPGRGAFRAGDGGADGASGDCQ